MDVPVILAALPGAWRARVAPAMAKEFFKAHFFPDGHTWREWFTNSAELLSRGVLLQRVPVAAARSGRAADAAVHRRPHRGGWSILIFPEGERADTGHIKPFRGGIGMIGSRLDVPVVPVRLEASTGCCTRAGRMARPGRCESHSAHRCVSRVTTTPRSPPQVEAAVRSLI